MNDNLGNNKENIITTKQIWVGIFFVILITGGMIASDIVIKLTKQEEVTPPKDKEIVLPAEPENISGSADFKILTLLKQPFYPPENIYTDKNVYKENLIDIALIGEFDKVELKVQGDIYNDLDNFVSVNIDGVSGTLGGYRKTANTLDLDKTSGIFNKKNNLDFTLNFLEPVKFSTTKEEFLSTFESTKNVVIWEYIKPPAFTGKGTIAKFLIAPYDENGKYGNGVNINKMELRYTCNGKSNSCKVAICDKEKKYEFGSQCLRDNFEKDFGEKSWESYSEYYKN